MIEYRVDATMSLGDPARIVWIATLLATIALLFRLWHEGLLATYKLFSLYLVSTAVSGIILLRLPFNSSTYAYAYFGSEFVFWLFQVLVTLELFTMLLRRYPGIQTLGKRLVTFSSAGALFGALLTVMFANTTHEFPVLDKFFLTARIVYLSIFLFLGLMLLFLVWFPVPLPRNTVRYAIGAAVYLPAKGLAFFTLNLFGPSVTNSVSLVLAIINAACLIYWTVALRQSGEESIVKVGHSWNLQEESRLVQQLESINTSLLGTARK
jgi:hypothetical protein